MTDDEISEKLARAIGWGWVIRDEGVFVLCRETGVSRLFEYRDPLVILPIAEHYGIFPHANMPTDLKATRKVIREWECSAWHYKRKRWGHIDAESAAKAIALAVIWSLT